MDMISQWSSPDEAETELLEMLKNKDKIMGSATQFTEIRPS